MTLAKETETRPVAEKATMKAIVQDRYGPPDVLHLEEINKPDISANEVLVKVHAAGMDRGTWHSMTGMPYLMRIMGFGLRRPKNRVAGLDAAGTVVAVGSDVTRFQASTRTVRTSLRRLCARQFARLSESGRTRAISTF